MYEYRVEYYESEERPKVVDHGLIGGQGSFRDAMDVLIDYYGDDQLHKVTLYYLHSDDHIMVYKDGVKSLAPNFVLDD